jgi:nucleoside-triphosphatase THEP1
MFVLLTGSTRAGKTTACWRAVPGLRATGLKLAGFVSPPILDEHGVKTGIEMVDLSTGNRATFARVVGHGEAPTIGVYKVLDGAADWARGVLSAALLSDADLLVIDEIGVLELHRGTGFAFALEPLSDPVRIPNAIVLVRRELADELAQRIGRTDTVYLEVTQENRLDIPNQLVKLMRAVQAN